MPPRASDRRTQERFLTAQRLQQLGRVQEAQAIYRDILRGNPRHADALHYLGLATLQSGRVTEGTRLIERALSVRPAYPEALANLAIAHAEQNRPDQALAALRKALAIAPNNAALHNLLGTVLHDIGRAEAALDAHARALALQPDEADAWNNQGNAQRALGRHDAALDSYNHALALQPDFIEAACNRALTQQAMRHFDDALATLDRVIRQAPDHAPAHEAHGNVLRDLKRPEAALQSFARAIALAPASATAHDGHGNTLQDLNRHAEAIRSHQQAVTLAPGLATAHNNLGTAMLALRRFQEALAAFHQAIARNPDDAAPHYNIGNTLLALHNAEAALPWLDRALSLRSDHADAHRLRGLVLAGLKRYNEALQSYDQAAALAPDTPWLLGDRLAVTRQVCLWSTETADRETLSRHLAQDQRAAAPFIVAAITASPAEHRRAAEVFAATLHPARDVAAPAAVAGGKIRLGYFSADFRDHAMMHVMMDLFRHHDRTRFESTAFSFGPDISDSWQRDAAAAFDRFIDTRALSDEHIAALSRRHGIDIAIDLMGYTHGCRPGIFAHRAAPVQVNYLGYPGTMGAPYIDYIIADPILAADGDEHMFAEKIVRLPETYQPNTLAHAIAGRHPTRAGESLPETAFVFCCLNNTYKITPEIFTLWTRVLHRVSHAVLWLYAENPEATANLYREAAQRGIAANRLVFAARRPLDQHLARQSLADLFLDTSPYNGHATASLALWAGVPVLTRRGATLAGRVAASLLTAVGLPELITTTDQEYESLAVALAADAGRLAALRTQLHANRQTAPLFNTARFTRHLEAGFAAMHARAVAGQKPDHIRVPALHDR